MSKPHPNRSTSPGFTLVEMVVVLALASLLLLLVPPLFSGGLSSAGLKSAAAQVAGGLRRARGRAILRGEETPLLLNVDERVLRIGEGGEALHLDTALSISLETARIEVSDPNEGAIRFYPDGSSTGGRITLARGERKRVVDVDWLTGRIQVTP